MKLTKFYLPVLLLATMLFNLNPLIAQDSEEPETPTGPIKNIFLDIGYGSMGLSSALGFRYSTFGLSIGIAGFASPRPKFAQIDGIIQNEMTRYPANFTDERYTTICVGANLYYYIDFTGYNLMDYQLDDFSAFLDIGYGMQSDSIIKKRVSPASTQGNDTRDVGQTYGPGRAETINDFTYGGGIQWRIMESTNIALGYHSKNGVYLQVGYYWR